MTKEITLGQAKSMMDTCPPDFTPEEWKEIRKQCLRHGHFNMGGQHYRIVEEQACGCPYAEAECAFKFTELSMFMCEVLCRGLIARLERKKKSG